ncbi:MAG TPA: hypothetical protein PK201_03215, partial [Accumulibacter sp.]|nr:hypothetical protein [Accumulibacter sp.]
RPVCGAGGRHAELLARSFCKPRRYRPPGSMPRRCDISLASWWTVLAASSMRSAPGGGLFVFIMLSATAATA